MEKESILSHEHNSLAAIEIAGALQVVYGETHGRDFELDFVQEEAVQAIGEALVTGMKSGYVEMATSTGKTLVESLIAEAAVRAGKRVLMLAPTIQAAKQIAGFDGRTGLGRFTDLHDEEMVSRHYGGAHANDQDRLVVSTYSGYLNESRNPRLGDFDIIIGDECHWALGAETSQAMLSYLPNAIKIGFSATPDFAVDRRSEEIFGDELYCFSLKDALEEGTINPITPLIYKTKAEIHVINNMRDFTEAELSPLIENSERNQKAIQMTLDLVADGRQGIIACIPGFENAHAAALAAELNKTIRAADIGSHLSKEEQSKRLRQYRDGELDVLTFTRALEESWDSPETSFCLNLMPTTSPRRTKQLMGRLFRMHEAYGIYIDFADDVSNGNKQQYTAAHALGLEEIDVNRVVGKYGAASKAKNASVASIFSDDIYRAFTRVQGQTLEEIFKAPEDLAPLFAAWNKKLGKDLPPELPYNLAFDTTTAQKLEKTITQLTDELGIQPEIEEIIERMQPTQQVARLLGSYAFRTNLADFEEHITALPDTESFDDLVMHKLIRIAIDSVLNTLAEREAGVVELRFGLSEVDINAPHTPREPSQEEMSLPKNTQSGKTYDDVGRKYGITRERVRQIETKTVSKLRHVSRSATLHGLLYERDEPEKTAKQPSEDPHEWLKDVDIDQYLRAVRIQDLSRPFDSRLMEVPVLDDNDPRPYSARLAATANEILHEASKTDITIFGTSDRDLERSALRIGQAKDATTALRAKTVAKPPSSEAHRAATLLALDTKIQELTILQNRISETV